MITSLKEKLGAYTDLTVFVAGVLIVCVGYFGYHLVSGASGAPVYEDVHVHSDFLMYLNNEVVDFSDDRYQSSIEQILHDDFHFHDNDDNVIHRHAADLTLAEFLESLGYSITDECITTDSREILCTDSHKSLELYVNGEIREDVIGYVPQEEDQILIYYGNPDNPAIQDYLEEITDESCIYSGTCPERGMPPPESCGITCELDSV